MVLSYKIKRLLIIAIAIIILALAANEGANLSAPDPSTTVTKTVYPNVPASMDPSIIDSNLDSANAVPSKSVIQKAAAAPKPLISAEAYLVENLDTGEIYSQFNSEHVYPIASLSKLIAALVVLHSMTPDEKVTVTQSALDAYGDAGHLALGETFMTSEMLYPMLLESSNDAAEVFAQSYGYDAFMAKMNEFAASLGMTSTSFKDPSGLSSGNISNTHDLFILAQYIYHSEQSLLNITKQTTYTVASTTDHAAHTWVTINPFPLDPHFIGGKTGRTNEAKESMISLFRYDYGGVSYPVAVIVLRSDFSTREIDSSILFEKFIQKIEGTTGPTVAG